MFTKNHYINIISLIIIIAISVVQISRLALNLGFNPIIPGIFISAFIFLPVFGISKLKFNIIKISEEVKISFVIVTTILTFSLAVFYINESFALNINDIKSWLFKLNNHIYPYGETIAEHFPFYYLFYIPFDLIGKLNILNSISIGIISYFIFRLSKSDKASIIRTFVIFLPPIIYAELADAGTILNFFAFFLLFLHSGLMINSKSNSILNYQIIAVLFGVIILTRSEFLVLIPFVSIFFFKNKMKLFLTFLITVGFIFFGTNMLFSSFFDESIFSVFSDASYIYSDLNMIFWMIFLGTTIYIGWMLSTLQELLFTSGLLFISLWVVLSFIQVLNDQYIISVILYKNYQLLTMAFFLFAFSINEYETDKFLGRIYEEK